MRSISKECLNGLILLSKKAYDSLSLLWVSLIGFVKKVHAYGGVVYHDVTNRFHAEKGIQCGADGLICVNNRAGGHLGIRQWKRCLTELSDLGVPLICAGGIGSEVELNAALEIGYDGVQMGTRFIATDECTTPQDYKDAIVNASEEEYHLDN